MLRSSFLLFPALMGLLFTGCGDKPAASSPSSTAAPASYPYTAVTTCGMVTDIVRQVSGDKATVQGLLGPGVDPHLYKPTRDDVAKLLEADIVFYSGLMLEGRMSDTFLKLSRKDIPVYPVTEKIEESYLMEPEGFSGHWDPHVWMDIQAWSQAVDAVAAALGEYDPANKTFYTDNAAAYKKQLAELDTYVRGIIATIPESSRYLVTAHDAFGYFSRAYGIQVRSAQGISTESEAGVADINALVDFMVAHKIKALFVESTVSDKNLRAIIEGCRSRSHEVRVGGELFSDAMGKEGTYEGTYLGMIDHNATLITRALGGQAPEGGWQGKLTPH